jgi:hypothetical protein
MMHSTAVGSHETGAGEKDVLVHGEADGDGVGDGVSRPTGPVEKRATVPGIVTVGALR